MDTMYDYDGQMRWAQYQDVDSTQHDAPYERYEGLIVSPPDTIPHPSSQTIK